jgi:UDP-glucuronate decarboxylase
MMNTPDEITGPINLGNPSEYTILEMANKIIELTGSKSKIKFDPLPQDDPIQRKPDITLAKKVLSGWQPKLSLEEGLTRTIDYFKNNLK